MNVSKSQQNSKWNVKVTFELTFKGEHSPGGEPYTKRNKNTANMNIEAETWDESEMKLRLAKELQKHFATINEFPEEIVIVRVTNMQVDEN